MNNHEKPKRSRSGAEVRRAGIGMMIPAILAASILVGTWLGWSFDKWMGTRWGILVGFALGIATGIRETIRLVKKMNSEIEKEDKSKR